MGWNHQLVMFCLDFLEGLKIWVQEVWTSLKLLSNLNKNIWMSRSLINSEDLKEFNHIGSGWNDSLGVGHSRAGTRHSRAGTYVLALASMHFWFVSSKHLFMGASSPGMLLESSGKCIGVSASTYRYRKYHLAYYTTHHTTWYHLRTVSSIERSWLGWSLPRGHSPGGRSRNNRRIRYVLPSRKKNWWMFFFQIP